MLKKILAGALIIAASLGFAGISEARCGGYYGGGYCAGDSYCGDGCYDNGGDYRGYGGGCGCRG